ncbi:uncharacterized protein LOC120159426 [Hibiscus syriacus]|uniref:uncharacterized protein LOC120159426 n=1 Tax=Hibiscus syriacus TaxID=106335 RepID=UPI001924B8F2|nr:uncharacterized protein LOC120159426 [Hibiscus syriacus]
MRLPARFCGWIETCVTTPRYSIALNGSLVGYFKGVRGVRQGDPLSPYLFVIVMNVLSRLLDVVARNGIFRFHPRCKRISLTHLCFADDLLIFCHGSMDSVLGVTSILEKFYHLSGLKLNALKTELYVCGINGSELEQIQAATVGLVFFLQLVLPKGVIHDIERLCMRFFWKGNDSPARGARKYLGWKLIKLHEEVRGLFPASGSWLQIKGDWIWNIIRDRKSKVAWHRVIWFPAHIPKFSLITWMAILDRLSTRERLCRFAVLIDASCGLCGTVLESRSHLFIDCSFSREVWNLLLQLCGLRM